MKRILVGATLFSLVITVILLAPGSASAGPNKTWIVDSSNGSSQAQFRDLDELLTACDTKADGLRAVAIAAWSANGVGHSVEVQDADGANGGCTPWQDINMPEGTTVKVSACARNGQFGALQFCRFIWATA